MTGANLPWRYSHLKYRVGYRRWEAIKSFNVANQKKNLLDSFALGKKTLFVHIPKTAGVSLIKTYDDYFTDARHSPALFYKLLLGRKYEDFSTFSIVRNPWARVFSAYNFLVAGGLIGTDSEMGRVLAAQCPTFERFIKEWLPRNGVCSYMHFVPQHEFVCGWGAGVIVDNIIKLELLDDDWPGLADTLGMPAREIPRANTSVKDDFRKFYDNESIEIVNSLYKKDSDLFNYSYE